MATSRGGLDRRSFIVDGTPLRHWSQDNFEPERDESCRVVYKPKEGPNFFRKSLRKEDFVVMRSHLIMEQPFFSKYNRFYPTKGHFCCKGCGNPLYSHKTKLKRDDGWPAFGACVDGAIGMTTAEERRAKAELERVSAVRIQAFVRGCMGRAKVSEKIGQLIERVMEIQRHAETEAEMEEEEDEDIDVDKSERAIHRPSMRTFSLLGHWSVHALDLSLGSSSSSSLASFGYDDDDDFLDTKPHKSTSEKNESGMPNRRDIAASAASAALKRSQDFESKNSQISAFNELMIEIHCHRCKSNLGKVYEETSTGQDGTTKYKERHCVNGRALKYVEDNLPRRTRIDSSLLFASTSQARLLGLKAAEPTRKEPEFMRARKSVAFVSPRSHKNKVTLGTRPGVGMVTFQSPERSPRKSIRSNQKGLDAFFLSKSVH